MQQLGQWRVRAHSRLLCFEPKLAGVGTRIPRHHQNCYLLSKHSRVITYSSQDQAEAATSKPDEQVVEDAPPPPPEQKKPHPIIRLLSSIPAPAWMVTFLQAIRRRDGKAIQVARVVLIGCVFIGVAFTRHLMDAKTAIKTREVLYSDFVTLLDSNRVRAARLESGTGRMYFDLLPREAAVAVTPKAAQVAETAAAATAVAATTATAVTAAASAAPDAAPAAAAATPAATHPVSRQLSSQRFQKQYVVKLADKNDYLLASKVLAAGVEFGVLKQSYTAVLANVCMTALALWIPLLPMFFLLRRIMEERSSTKKKKSDNKSNNVSVTFKDVAGVDSAKEELMEVVTVMKAAKSSYNKLRVKIPSGVLLCGPPGTGKTLLAKAVAGEAGIPFYAFSASEFVELFVGRGAARIREVFAEARKATPCVVFIDELDAVGARRGMGYNDERDQTLNQLLTELDGFEGRQGILFLAATNRMEILDPALLRPGRINRKVTVPLPDESGRRDILRVHLRTTPMTSVEDKVEACERLARVTQGFSGAELANVVNEGTLLAARKDQEVVTLRELLEGVQRTRFGVNGAGSPQGLGAGFQKWLMDVATAPDSRRVKNATA